MHLSSLLERTAIFILSLPILLLLVTRLAWYRTFIALFIYYVIGFAYALMDGGYIKLDTGLIRNIGIMSNLLDAPLTLLFLTYLSRTSFFKKQIYLTIGLFVIYEAIILYNYGYTVRASTIITIPGLVLTLLLSLTFAIHQVKITVVYHKAAGKALFASALFFAYVGYTYVYYVFYFMHKTFQDDAKLVFNMITILCTVAISLGLLFERKRVAKLFEIKTTREELKALYANEETKTIAPLEAIVFNIDTHWKREAGKTNEKEKHESTRASESLFD